jgi:hypothetical protein
LECVEIQQAFAGKHWSELSQETLIRENYALAFLTPEAFRFYLPAYLSNVVREFDKSDALRFFLTWDAKSIAKSVKKIEKICQNINQVLVRLDLLG